MAYGYLGQNTPNQTVNNSGVFSITDSANLQSQGKLGGSLELIEEQTVSGVSQVDFTSIKQNVYDVLLLQYNNFIPTVDSSSLRVRFYESGVLETADVYQWAHQVNQSNGGVQEQNETATSNFRIALGSGNDEAGNGYVYFYNLGNSSKYSFVTYQAVGMNTTSVMNSHFGGGVLKQASEVDGIRLYTNNPSLSITAKLYGVKQI
jgi:hypothetical protein